MSRRAVTWLDVFTSTPLTGNPLAVVHDADGLPDTVMQAFARETQLSETSFLQSPGVEGADYRHRIFMVRHEIPFAGHPSLGSAVAAVRARGERQATVRQQTVPGVQPIDVEVDGDRAHASMLQEPATFGPELDPAEVLPAAGLRPEDVHPEHGVAVVGTGVPQVLAFVRDASVLDRARLADPAALTALIDAHRAVVLYVVALDGERAAARSFFPGGEDSATGAAAGPLCAFAHARTGASRVTITQGVQMGRPSRLDTAVEGDRVRVGGDAVVVLDGEVALDA